ncbi:cysteine desulfurase family protein [Shewanella kaireitica]|uniref:cysteine desulfurase family protein n=1 Tax=Shewanella kaireitica TaxID=212021 RepID=UPI00200D363B|nr:cysteine desulfurase [Shewanella kaireitica]
MNLQHLKGYFDYNATTPISEGVALSMQPAINLFANPSSPNRYSVNSHAAISQARDNIADLLSTDARKIFFTSGGSEANNWAIKGVLFKHLNNPGHIITSSMEHPSVLDTVRYCVEELGFRATYLQPDAAGHIKISDFESALTIDTQLVSVMYANNETGAIQPIEQLCSIAAEYKIPVHVDAVQFVGKRLIDVELLGVDFLSLSAHKFYGPKGVGCLYIKDKDAIGPLIHGGGQEFSMRSGTENLVAMSGISVAAEEANRELVYWDSHCFRLKKQMMDLLEAAPIALAFNGATDYDSALSNTLNISIDGIRGEALALRLEILHGFIISVGSACSNNKTKQLSHVLMAMGLTEERVLGAIRVSFGCFTDAQQVSKFVDALVTEVQQLLHISGGEAL